MQDSYPLHVMGGVDKLRANGFTGKGIFIGVVDSGIDFMHPALGKGFGPGFKVIAGESLVTDAYKTTPAAVPNGDLVSNLERFFFWSGVFCGTTIIRSCTWPDSYAFANS